jgi:hypothetical protein
VIRGDTNASQVLVVCVLGGYACHHLPGFLVSLSRRMILCAGRRESRGDEIEFYHVASAWESKKLLACVDIYNRSIWVFSQSNRKLASHRYSIRPRDLTR